LVKVVNPGEGFIASNGLGARESMARCCNNWIFVAPTVMAMAMVSRNSSSVAPSCPATARQYRVHGSHPAANEAPKAIRCFVLRSRAPSA
jgi:hypothetical protein